VSLLELDDCLLLIIDVQDKFYDPEREDVDWVQFRLVADRVTWIADLASALHVPVIVTEEDPARSGHTVEQVRAVLPSHARTFAKDAFSAYANPEIAAAISATGKRTAVLVGLETDVCVAHSALELAAAPMRVAVIADATFSPGAAHSAGLARLSASPVDLLTTKELIYDWLRSVSALHALRSARPDLLSPRAGLSL
jgi:nicotinamidase-related amidase